MGERILFQAGVEQLEGLLEMNSREVGMVITHPHPLYGGTMDDTVVEAIARACRAKGYSLLKFNFRGVGKSTGRYENGSGEQEDVHAAIACLHARGINNILLAGYSFGTFVNVRAVSAGTQVQKLLLVSPPVAMMDFSDPKPLPSLKLIVTGSRDDIAPAALIEKLLFPWNPEAKLEVIAGADHFYSGHRQTLTAVLSRHI